MSTLLPMPFRVAILGGGLSGLSAAHTVLKYAQVPTEVILFEAEDRFGGWLHSTKFDDGTVFEHGPRSARSYGKAAVDALTVLSELDIDDQFIGVPKTADAASRRFIYANDQVLEIPRGIALAKKWGPLPKSLIGYGIKEPFVKQSKLEDESMYDFFKRRFQSQEIADYLCDPMCRGIFGGDSKKLSVRSCFPILYDFERQHGSIVKGLLFSKSSKSINPGSLTKKSKEEKWTAWTMKGGIQSLPNLWSKHLREKKGLITSLGTSCQKMEVIWNNEGRRKVHAHTNKGSHEFDHVFSSVSAPVLSSIIQEQNSKLSGMLDQIDYVTMGVVTLEYKDCINPYTGFGYLVPSCEPLDILGVTFDSQIFPQHADTNSSVVTVMAGGENFLNMFGDPDTADTGKLTELAVKSIKDTLKFDSDPVRYVCRINKDCIPQYRLGHHKLAEMIEKHLLAENMPLTIIGNMWGGASVNDVIMNAKNNTLKWLTANHLY